MDHLKLCRRLWRQKRPLSCLKAALPLGLALLLAITLNACGVRQITRGELEPPKVTLKALTLGIPTPEGWPLSLSLHLANPNAQTLTVLGYDYEVWLEERSVIQGESRATVTLPALGETTVEAPLFLKLPAILGMLPSVLTQEKLRYRVAGGLRLTSLLGGLRVPFRFQGQISPQQGLDHLRLYLR